MRRLQKDSLTATVTHNGRTSKITFRKGETIRESLYEKLSEADRKAFRKLPEPRSAAPDTPDTPDQADPAATE